MKILVLGDFQGSFPKKLKRKLKKEVFELIIGVGDYGGIPDWRPWIMKMLENARKGKKRLTPVEFFGVKKFRKLLKKDENATKKVLKELNSLGKPVLIVFGNGDDGWYRYPFVSHVPKLNKSLVNFLSKLKNLKDINYGQTKFRKITYIGFGGYMDIESYLDKKVFPDSADKEMHHIRFMRLQKSKKNLFLRLKKTKGERIFVFHYPPIGVFDIIKDRKDNPMNRKSAGVRFFREAINKYKPKLALCGHMHEYQGAKKIGRTLVVNPGDAEKSKYAIIDYPSLKVKVVK